MLAVTIIQGVNNYRLTLGCQPLAVRETDNEMGKIISARNVFKENKNATILDFVHAFNAQNDFNQITHAVGSHINHFSGGQAYENRMCVVHKKLHSYGCDGDLFTDEYTWSIIDW